MSSIDQIPFENNRGLGKVVRFPEHASTIADALEAVEVQEKKLQLSETARVRTIGVLNNDFRRRNGALEKTNRGFQIPLLNELTASVQEVLLAYRENYNFLPHAKDWKPPEGDEELVKLIEKRFGGKFEYVEAYK
ncbi:MAG TPA: hypothetical protein VJH06_02830 [Candidatus Paceibacterota bacterium]